jgi:glycosyltransferase involved in cell wall biosynthesis
MRILLLTETLCAGGAETFVVRLANALAGERNEVMIAVMHGEMIHPAVAAKVDPRVALETLKLPAKRTMQRADRVVRALRIDLPLVHGLQRRWLQDIVRRWKPEVVHSHLVKADWLAAEVKSDVGGFRHILTAHGEQLAYSGRTADPQMLGYDRKLRATLAQADGIAVISDQQQAHFREDYGLSDAAVTRISNGYEAPGDGAGPSRAELGLPEDKLIFGMVSRGIADKGWAEAIEAFGRLQRDDCALVLVGNGPFFDTLGDAPPGVILAGFSANPIEYIRHFDAGLLPSFYLGESLPTVIVEYMLCGVPVVASDIGEIPAMMRAPDGDLAGILVPHADRARLIDELTAAMALMAADPELRQHKGKVAVEAARKFDMAACVGAYTKLYRGDS